MFIHGIKLHYASFYGMFARRKINTGQSGFIHTMGNIALYGGQPKQASWMVQKILKAHQFFTEAGIQEADVLSMNSFSINTTYKRMRGESNNGLIMEHSKMEMYLVFGFA